MGNLLVSFHSIPHYNCPFKLLNSSHLYSKQFWRCPDVSSLVPFTLKVVFEAQRRSWRLWRDDAVLRKKNKCPWKDSGWSLFLYNILTLECEMITTKLIWGKGKGWSRYFHSNMWHFLPWMHLRGHTSTTESTRSKLFGRCRNVDRAVFLRPFVTCNPWSKWCCDLHSIQLFVKKKTVNRYKTEKLQNRSSSNKMSQISSEYYFRGNNISSSFDR